MLFKINKTKPSHWYPEGVWISYPDVNGEHLHAMEVRKIILRLERCLVRNRKGAKDGER